MGGAAAETVNMHGDATTLTDAGRVALSRGAAACCALTLHSWTAFLSCQPKTMFTLVLKDNSSSSMSDGAEQTV